MFNAKAYAKINLGLKITGKRDDGYHNIDTIFHRVNIFDTLTFTHAEFINMESSSLEIPVDDSNLCMKAAHLLCRHTKRSLGVKINLEKHIPVGAGLGGGSSDAATTLLALNKFWGLDVSKNELAELALELGSDVPYFLQQGSAVAGGRGEILDYCSLNIPYWILLVFPGVHVSTPWAYRQLNISQRRKEEDLPMKEIAATLQFSMSAIAKIKNDFEPVVFQEYPLIAGIKEELLHRGAVFALMSGSGSSLYGFYDSEDAVRQAMNEFGKRFRVFLTPPHFEPENQF